MSAAPDVQPEPKEPTTAVADDTTPAPEGPAAEVLEGGKGPATPGHWTDEHPKLVGNEGLKRFGTVEDLGTSYLNLQQKLHSNGLRVPADKAPKSDWDEFHKSRGRPDEAGGYFEGMQRPDGVAWNDDLAVELAVLMKERGIPASDGKALFEKYISVMTPGFEALGLARETAAERAVEQLKEAWTPAEYPKRLAEANEGGKVTWESGWKNIANIQLMDGSLLGNHLDFATGLSRLGARLGEDEVLGVKPASAHSYTPESAQQKIRELMGDGNTDVAKAYTDPAHPMHAETRKMMTDVFRQAFPEE